MTERIKIMHMRISSSYMSMARATRENIPYATPDDAKVWRDLARESVRLARIHNHLAIRARKNQA